MSDNTYLKLTSFSDFQGNRKLFAARSIFTKLEEAKSLNFYLTSITNCKNPSMKARNWKVFIQLMYSFKRRREKCNKINEIIKLEYLIEHLKQSRSLCDFSLPHFISNFIFNENERMMIIVVVCFILLQSISLSFAYSLFFFIPFLHARNEHFIRTIELKNYFLWVSLETLIECFL